MSLPAENPTSTAPNYTSRDDGVALHPQEIETTGLADTVPRSLSDRQVPIEADLVGPVGQYLGWEDL